jgi:hypothetical protein
MYSYRKALLYSMKHPCDKFSNSRALLSSDSSCLYASHDTTLFTFLLLHQNLFCISLVLNKKNYNIFKYMPFRRMKHFFIFLNVNVPFYVILCYIRLNFDNILSSPKEIERSKPSMIGHIFKSFS